MELLYRYLAGDEFRHRVEAIVETFTAMEAQLSRERRAMENIWREREKQIRRIVTNTVGIYGEMRGIIGATLPQIESLDLGEVKQLEGAKECAAMAADGAAKHGETPQASRQRQDKRTWRPRDVEDLCLPMGTGHSPTSPL